MSSIEECEKDRHLKYIKISVYKNISKIEIHQRMLAVLQYEEASSYSILIFAVSLFGCPLPWMDYCLNIFDSITALSTEIVYQSKTLNPLYTRSWYGDIVEVCMAQALRDIATSKYQPKHFADRRVVRRAIAHPNSESCTKNLQVNQAFVV